ncbi:MAG: hypothetical protein R2731_05595 [Nocardioides sp.]
MAPLLPAAAPARRIASLATAAALVALAFVSGYHASPSGQSAPTPAATSAGSAIRQVAAVTAVRSKATGPVKNVARTYKLPAIGPVGGFSVKFPKLPKGKYLMNYSIVAGADVAGASMLCAVDRPTFPAQGVDYGSTFLTYATSHSTTVVDTAQGFVRLRCQVTNGATIDPDPDATAVSEVSFVKVDGIKRKTARQIELKRSGGSGASSSGS